MDSDDFSESEYSSEEEVTEPDIVQPKAQKSTRHLEDLKNKLGLDEFKDKAAANTIITKVESLPIKTFSFSEASGLIKRA